MRHHVCAYKSRLVVKCSNAMEGRERRFRRSRRGEEGFRYPEDDLGKTRSREDSLWHRVPNVSERRVCNRHTALGRARADDTATRLELPAADGACLERDEMAIRHWKRVRWPALRANDRLRRRERD